MSKTRFSFENIHRNKKLAFLDGFLCGLVIAYIMKSIEDDLREFNREYPAEAVDRYTEGNHLHIVTPQ